MASKATPLVKQAIRSYTTSAKAANYDRLGSAAAVGYWCAVVSAPLAGAFAISQAATTDKRLANM